MTKVLHKHFLKTITGLFLLSLFASCISGVGFHKRKYTKGLYVDKLGSVKKPPSQRTYYPVEQHTPLRSDTLQPAFKLPVVADTTNVNKGGGIVYHNLQQPTKPHANTDTLHNAKVSSTLQLTPQQPAKPVASPDTSNDNEGGGIVMINYQQPLVFRKPPPVIHKDNTANKPKSAPDTAINNLKSNITFPHSDTLDRTTVAIYKSNAPAPAEHKHKRGLLGILGFILVMLSIFTGYLAFYRGLAITAAITSALPWLTFFVLAFLLLVSGMILCGISVYRQEPVIAFGYAGLIIGGLWIIFVVGGYLID
jgi:hypothetical protein